ncbi:MAG: DNA helicase [Lentinula lateritia]|uniref:ATP-dependent DNA helicase n=1 Tax=Lentinula lateritia TaxID=40482 RepID=A0ABQ8VCV9_9AGAR|nr:MAG: DNA helicase [Lentinula lateritia]KAJ4487511.1 DNA helicase [Lentinula lateritia]
MSIGPKNNLDDVLKKRGSISDSNTLSSLPVLVPKAKSKFKPSTNASPSSSTAALGHNALPSFRTPGFGKPKARKSELEASTAREVIDLSCSSPSPRSKRQLETQHITDAFPSKRRRSGLFDDKENLSFINGDMNGKGKAKEMDDVEGLVDVCSKESTERASLTKRDLYDPFDQLDIDFPSFKRNPRLNQHPQNPTQDHKDLESKSVAELRGLLEFVLSLQHTNNCSIEQFRKSQNSRVDIVTLEGIETLFSSRINAIRQILESKEGTYCDPSLVTSPYFNDIHNSSSVSIASSETLNGLSSDHNRFSSDPILDSFEDDIEESDYHTGPNSDDFYWPEDDMDYEAPELSAVLDASFSAANKSLAEVSTSREETPDHTAFANHPFYKEIMRNLQRVFRLKNFRQNQLEAILAAMAGRDVFVLMPTGGGKSLCYQLPAVCNGGSTKGVTIVISPLLSLMTNQVDALKTKDVDVLVWNSETVDHGEIMRRLRGYPKPSLLYVSPEKVKDSGALKSIFVDLYRAGDLARFVVDEAHCISTWGHDFREAYQCLDSLRETYPRVPIMALTATANQTMVDDIMKRLKLKGCAFFQQSFNRVNLNYLILDKKAKILDDIYSFINTKHRGETGIIYCLGRDKCEKVAGQLRQKGLKARHFHAQMSTTDKEQVLQEWQSDRIQIVVATVAFGMGIDKANVRFVIHHDLPKSLDGYYQETGRAGRDQKPADCLLFYSYRDYKVIVKMINNPRNGDSSELASPEARERQELQARIVMQYCLNVSDCRRVQLLQFFGEKFERRNCHQFCDNCRHAVEMVEQDLTEEAKAIVSLVQHFHSITTQLVTLDQCRTIFRGADTSFIRERNYNRLPQYGAGKHLDGELHEQLFKRLCFLEGLDEVSMQGNGGWHVYYLKPGKRAGEISSGREKVKLFYRPKATKVIKASSSSVAKTRKGKGGKV